MYTLNHTDGLLCAAAAAAANAAAASNRSSREIRSSSHGTYTHSSIHEQYILHSRIPVDGWIFRARERHTLVDTRWLRD